MGEHKLPRRTAQYDVRVTILSIDDALVDPCVGLVLSASLEQLHRLGCRFCRQQFDMNDHAVSGVVCLRSPVDPRAAFRLICWGCMDGRDLVGPIVDELTAMGFSTDSLRPYSHGQPVGRA